MHLLRARFGDIFSPSAMVRWVCNSRDSVLCTRVLLLQDVFGKIWTQVTCTMQQASRVFFLFACLKACFRLSLSTRNKKKRTITSKKHAYRPETSYVLYYSLKDGEILCLGRVSTNLFRLFYAGEIQNLNCRTLEMATYAGIFFLHVGAPRHQRMWRFCRRSPVVGGWTQAQPCKNTLARQEYATLIKFCTLCSELHTGSALMFFFCLLAAKLSQILNSLHCGWGAHRSERFLFRMKISWSTVGSCTIIKMKTTVVLNKYRLVYSIFL